MPRQQKSMMLLLVLLAFSLLACDPYVLTGRVRPTPSVAAAPAPGGETGAPAAAPVQETRPPDLAEQVRALEARVSNLESQVRALEQAATAAPERPSGFQAKAPASKAPTPAPPAPAKTGVEDKTFSDGMRLYQGKKYAAAREKFHAYLRSQPQGAKAAEARFYLADSFYQEKKYKEAGIEFNKLVTQHPKSVLAPAAMLRQALCYNQLQQRANYQATLKKLVQKYPQSPEAKEAQKWLKEGR